MEDFYSSGKSDRVLEEKRQAIKENHLSFRVPVDSLSPVEETGVKVEGTVHSFRSIILSSCHQSQD